MANELPRVNGLAAKLRGRHYTAPRLAAQTEAQKGPVMRKRARYYRGRKLAAQSESQKGPVMRKRARYYRGRKLAAQSEAQKGPALKKRARRYQTTGQKESRERPFFVTNCEFQLMIGNCTINCARISNLVMEQEIETVPEGGSLLLNLFPADKKRADVLTVEKALISDEIMENLEAGVQIREGVIAVYRGKALFQTFSFEEGMITKCEYTNLDAMGHEILLKKLEITHSGLEAW